MGRLSRLLVSCLHCCCSCCCCACCSPGTLSDTLSEVGDVDNELQLADTKVLGQANLQLSEADADNYLRASTSGGSNGSDLLPPLPLHGLAPPLNPMPVMPPPAPSGWLSGFMAAATQSPARRSGSGSGLPSTAANGSIPVQPEDPAPAAEPGAAFRHELSAAVTTALHRNPIGICFRAHVGGGRAGRGGAAAMRKRGQQRYAWQQRAMRAGGPFAPGSIVGAVAAENHRLSVQQLQQQGGGKGDDDGSFQSLAAASSMAVTMESAVSGGMGGLSSDLPLSRLSRAVSEASSYHSAVQDSPHDPLTLHSSAASSSSWQRHPGGRSSGEGPDGGGGSQSQSSRASAAGRGGSSRADQHPHLHPLHVHYPHVQAHHHHHTHFPLSSSSSPRRRPPSSLPDFLSSAAAYAVASASAAASASVSAAAFASASASAAASASVSAAAAAAAWGRGGGSLGPRPPASTAASPFSHCSHPAVEAFRAGQLGLGFSGGGFLFPWHLGVVTELSDMGVIHKQVQEWVRIGKGDMLGKCFSYPQNALLSHHTRMQSHLAGASGGAIIVACVNAGLDLHDLVGELLQVGEGGGGEGGGGMNEEVTA